MANVETEALLSFAPRRRGSTCRIRHNGWPIETMLLGVVVNADGCALVERGRFVHKFQDGATLDHLGSLPFGCFSPGDSNTQYSSVTLCTFRIVDS